jgi:hypothetical protein
MLEAAAKEWKTLERSERSREDHLVEVKFYKVLDRVKTS